MRSTQIKQRLKQVGRLSLKAALLGLVFFGLYRLYTYLFTITEISCEYQNQLCTPEVLAELNRSKNEKLIFVDSQQIQQKILGSNPAYSSAEVTKQLPGKLLVSVEKAKDIAQFGTSTQSAVLLISENNIVSGYQDQTQKNLDLILTNDAVELNVGDSLDESHLSQAVLVVEELQKAYIPYERFNVDQERGQILLKNNILVVLDITKDIQKQIRSLQLVINDNFDPAPTYIDLRFSKPVVKFDEGA